MKALPTVAFFALCAALLCGCDGLLPVLRPPIDPGPEPPAANSKELPAAQAARVCWAAGEEMRKRGMTAEAIAQYEKVRAHDPHFPRVAWRLAVLYDQQGNGARATIEYNQAMEAEPRNPDLLNDLGYYYYQRGSYAEAEKWLRASLAVNPKHERAWGNLGLTLGHQGKAEESLECFTHLLPPALAHCNVGVLLANHGQRDDARRYFREALRLDPTLVQAKTFLAGLDQPPEKPAPPAEKPAGSPPVSGP